MRDRLVHNLLALRTGGPSADALAEVREIIGGWPVGDPLRDALWSADWSDPASDAAALLPLLGADHALSEPLRRAIQGGRGPALEGAVAQALGVAGGAPAADVLAEAVRAEAGRVEVLSALWGHDGPLAAAIATEAGEVSVVAPIMAALARGGDPAEADLALSALLDQALSPAAREGVVARLASDGKARRRMSAWADNGRRLREGIGVSAGRCPPLWHPVAEAMGLDDPEAVPGWDGTLLRDAVVEGAGDVDTAGDILRAITPRAAKALPADLPEPANNTRWWPAGLILVAAAALVWVMPRLVLDGGLGGEQATGGFSEQSVRFATAEELSVEQVTTGDDASVFVEMPADEGAPMIIWVHDGGNL